jgi:hypothetical protein
MQLYCEQTKAPIEVQEGKAFPSSKLNTFLKRRKRSQSKKKFTTIENISENVFKNKNFIKKKKKFLFIDTLKTPKMKEKTCLLSLKEKSRKQKIHDDEYEMPLTPHNTSQYLISNFSIGRTENKMNLISSYTSYLKEDISNMMTDGILTVEDFCISGGSMKGLLNGEIMLENDESFNLTKCSTQENSEEATTPPDDDLTFNVQFNDFCFNSDDVQLSKIQNNFMIPKFNEENEENCLKRPSNEYMNQILNQQKEIQFLLQKLKKL